jgi:UDP-4-amino-4,6-dideoxy-N-acetyl-beta-L-altrosamine N-acetyltransferase
MLKLRKITDNDTPLILKMRNSEEVKRNFVIQDDFTEENQKYWMENVIAKNKAVQYIILFDSVPIGSVYINNIDYIHKKGEFGIYIGDSSYRGKSIGVGAAKEIIRIAFEELKLHRLYLRVFPENVSAVRCYEKAGFCFEGLLRDTVSTNGIYRDMMLMSIVHK